MQIFVKFPIMGQSYMLIVKCLMLGGNFHAGPLQWPYILKVEVGWRSNILIGALHVIVDIVHC